MDVKDIQGVMKTLGMPSAIIAVWSPGQLTKTEQAFVEGKPGTGKPMLKEAGGGATDTNRSNSYHVYTDNERQYVKDHIEDGPSKIAKALGLKNNSVKGLIMRMRKTEELPAAGVEETDKTEEDSQTDGPDPLTHKPFFEQIKDRFAGFKLPSDFDNGQQFKVGCYVYHAPARKVGTLTELNVQADTAQALVAGRVLFFTARGARAMYDEMMARAK